MNSTVTVPVFIICVSNDGVKLNTCGNAKFLTYSFRVRPFKILNSEADLCVDAAYKWEEKQFFFRDEFAKREHLIRK